MSAPIDWPDAARRAAFEAWFAPLATAQGLDAASLAPASADASFRRYFRVEGAGGATRIVMDAPPPQEDVRPFVDVAARLAAGGLNVPRVVAEDAVHGFLLLTDLGTAPYLGAFETALAADDAKTCDALMRDALAALVRLQTHVDAVGLPAYDRALLERELALFPEWCVGRELNARWTDAKTAQWRAACELLVASALAQPTTFVHRDYMPRNLMVCAPEAGNPGVLDFQDAVRGPLAYDLASLLRDAFLSWDESQEIDWAVRYWQAARPAGLPVPDDFGEFWRQVEWMGLQRHLKVLGIFCRLKHRDGKPRYSHDLPRFFDYAHKVAARYNALRPLARLLEPLMGATPVEVFR